MQLCPTTAGTGIPGSKTQGWQKIVGEQQQDAIAELLHLGEIKKCSGACGGSAVLENTVSTASAEDCPCS